eukprot:jgi/Mesen1/2419/ME000157S01556
MAQNAIRVLALAAFVAVAAASVWEPSRAGSNVYGIDYYDEDPEWFEEHAEAVSSHRVLEERIASHNERRILAGLDGPPLTMPNTAGPCSANVISMQASTLAELNARVTYPPTQTVWVTLTSDIVVTASLVFGKNFSCTVVQSAYPTGSTISALTDTFPPLVIKGANNILTIGINVNIPVGSTSGFCNMKPYGKEVPTDFGGTRFICPAIFVDWSWGIQITQATVYGRIDLTNINNTVIDSLNMNTYFWDNATIRVMNTGDSPLLIGGNVSVTNNNITGAWVGVMVYNHAAGVLVANNYISRFYQNGIQLGQGVHFVGDAMLNTVVNNYVITLPTDIKMPDNAGIYFDLHWVNPGNYLSGNYILGGEHCYYLDYASSFITINGGVCYYNKDGVKINTGHGNNVTDMLVVTPQSRSGWISAQNYYINNCALCPGCYWEKVRRMIFNTPIFTATFPYLNDWCSRTQVSGVTCNPASGVTADVTGACSGIPTNNVLMTYVIDPKKGTNYPLAYLSITGVPAVPDLNSMAFSAMNSTGLGFNNPQGLDYGLSSGSSPLLAKEPSFTAVAIAKVGPQPVPLTQYYSYFNQPSPVWAKVYTWPPVDCNVPAATTGTNSLSSFAAFFGKPQKNPATDRSSMDPTMNNIKNLGAQLQFEAATFRSSGRAPVNADVTEIKADGSLKAAGDDAAAAPPPAPSGPRRRRHRRHRAHRPHRAQRIRRGGATLTKLTQVSKATEATSVGLSPLAALAAMARHEP